MVIIGEAYRRRLRYIADRLLPRMADDARMQASELLEQMERDEGLEESELVRLMRIMKPSEEASGDSSDSQQQTEERRTVSEKQEVEKPEDSEWMLEEQMKIQMFSLLTHVRKMHMRRLKEIQREAMRRDIENRIGK